MPLEVGVIVEGTVSGITNFGAFVELGEGKTGLVHISEVADDYVKNIREYLQDKQKVKVKVLSINPDGKISLSIRQAALPKKKSTKPTEVDWGSLGNNSYGGSFEDKMSRFMKDSEEKMQVIRNKNKASGGGGRRSNGHANKKNV